MRGRKPERARIEARPMNDAFTTVPKRPAGLPKESYQDWLNTAPDLVERGLLSSATMPLLETYLSALLVVRQARKSVAQDGAILKSKDGTPKANPAVAMLEKYGALVARLGSELGLTPAARSRAAIRQIERPKEETHEDPWA